MRLAIIAVTHQGSLLASQLAQRLHQDDTTNVYVKSNRNKSNAVLTFDSLKMLVGEIFHKYDGLIFIMATGIVVRVIAPFIQSKRTDPAVVVLDDRGNHAISLLSGHLGGANELANRVGHLIGARPVITTATDVANKTAADVLAVLLGLKIDPFEQLKTVNAAIANNAKVKFFLDASLPRQQEYLDAAAAKSVKFNDLSKLNKLVFDAAVILTDKILQVDKPHLFLRPPTFVLGIGCRRNIGTDEIKAVVFDACKRIDRSPKSIAAFASSIIKQHENGLLTASKEMSVPAHFYDNENLNRCIEKHQLKISSFVKEQIGVGNVCEAAALVAGNSNQLLLPKTKYPKITVAIAPVN